MTAMSEFYLIKQHFLNIFNSNGAFTANLLSYILQGAFNAHFFQDNEEVVEGPEKMVTVPPNHYCVIRHPVIRDSAGEVVLESSGQVSLFI